jgi:hypothetical protein
MYLHFSGPTQVRTGNLHHAMVLLYQLELQAQNTVARDGCASNHCAIYSTGAHFRQLEEGRGNAPRAFYNAHGFQDRFVPCTVPSKINGPHTLLVQV